MNDETKWRFEVFAQVILASLLGLTSLLGQKQLTIWLIGASVACGVALLTRGRCRVLLLVGIPLACWLLAHQMSKPPFPPKISVVTKAMNVPTVSEGVRSSVELENRRIQTVEIYNPNLFPLISLELRIQLPEVVERSVVDPSAAYTVICAEEWDSQPIRFGGKTVPLVNVEPLGEEEKTGIRRLSVNPLPPRSTVRLHFVTMVEQGAHVYQDAVAMLMSHRKPGTLLWYFGGTYQYESGGEIETGALLVPLDYNQRTRSLWVLHPDNLSGEQTPIEINQGKGFRLEGLARIQGYIYSSNGMWSMPAPVVERDDIVFMAGLEGDPPSHPFVKVIWRTNSIPQGVR